MTGQPPPFEPDHELIEYVGGRPPASVRRRSRAARGGPVGDLLLDEKRWQDEVLRIAEVCGWQRRYHTFDSRRSTPGFPDLVLCRPPRLIFAELKSESGRVTREQWDWIAALQACGLECHVWRPSDRAEVDLVLAARARNPLLEVHR